MQVRKLGKEIQKEADGIRSQIDSLSKDVDALDKKNDRKKQQLTEKASSIGDTFLRLEKCATLSFAWCRWQCEAGAARQRAMLACT